MILSPNLITSIVALVQRVGTAIMEIYRTGEADVNFKSDASPVTRADLLAHHMLVNGLSELLPSVPVISEEGAYAAIGRPITDPFWLIDPLDGTKEFLSRNGEFTVNVALIVDGRPAFGVVVAPALEQTYWGTPMGGAFRADAAGIKVIRTTVQMPGAPLRVVASKNHMNAQTREFIAGLGNCQLMQVGSSLKICRIAEGMADLYPRLGPTSEWDTAAAHAVLEGAGGTLRTLTGENLHYGKNDILNPFFIAAAPGCSNLT